MQLCGSVNIFWHCSSLGLQWKLSISSPVATSEFSKFPGILSAALLQHHLLEFEIAQVEFSRSPTRLSDFTFTFHFHALKKEMATHSSVLAWRIPGTGEPGGLPSLGSHRVGHDWSDLAAAAAAAGGIPSPPLALFVVMLPKAHLTPYYRISGSR